MNDYAIMAGKIRFGKVEGYEHAVCGVFASPVWPAATKCAGGWGGMDTHVLYKELLRLVLAVVL
jgi:hypothetical protein